MKPIGLFYSFNSHKTKRIGEHIAGLLGEGGVETINAEIVTEEEFMKYDRLILGVPTWFDGELPNYWDEFVPALEDLDLTGKKVAIYGLADQVGYPENFADGVGVMARLLRSRGAEIVGETSTEGYTFETSRAVEEGRFLGLILDQENQGKATPDRIRLWLEQLKTSM